MTVSSETLRSISTPDKSRKPGSGRSNSPLQPFFDKSWRPSEIEPSNPDAN